MLRDEVLSKESKVFVLDSCIADMPRYNKTIKVEGIPGIPPSVIPVVKAPPTAEKVLKKTIKLLSSKENKQS